MARIRFPLQTLPYFEAAARHGSFTEAARELNVTQSAVSRQVKSLEQRLGTLLFHRRAQGLALTERGAYYLQAVQRALDLLESATLETLAYPHAGGVLRIGALPTFGTRWLVPRLGDFRARYPEIVIDLVTLQSNFPRGRYMLDWDLREIDVAILFGGDEWEGLVADRIMQEEIAPVCSARYLTQHPIAQPEDLRGCVLLECRTRHANWRTWVNEIGPHDLDVAHALGFEHYYMVIAAAIAQLGVALLPLPLVADDLASGLLVRPLPQSLTSVQGYYLLRTPIRNRDPQVRKFVAWLLEQANGP